MELADQQNQENEGVVSGAEIPSSPEGDKAPASSVETPSSPEKPLSLRDQLNKSFEAVRTEEAKRARAADGKFTKLEASAEAAAAPEIPKPATEAKPAASPAEGPPSAWKAIWETMTPEARAIAVKREGDVSKGFDEYRSKVKQYEAIDQVLAPARARFQQQGIANDADALRNIISWEQGLSNPATRVTAFRNLAQQLGIDLSTLVPSSSQAYSPDQDIPNPLRPVIDQFGNEISAVRQEIQNLHNERTSQQLAAFAKDKPHFEKVSVLMGHIMAAGTATDLDSAYQQAIRAHPEVSAQIEAERVAKEAAERERTQAEKIAAARKAAVSPPVRSPHGGPADASQRNSGNNRSVRESLDSVVAQLRDGQRA